MNQILRNCDCEDWPCCVHADNSAIIKPIIKKHVRVFECDGPCCLCDNYEDCTIRECGCVEDCEDSQHCEFITNL
jgi:hypothetical protein